MTDVDFATQLRDALNPRQLRAATATEGAHLVIAGAGSGKTRTLTHRVAHLVASGVRPESILLLTFTRRAAAEMLRRAADLLDARCRRVAGGTFHSFAVQTLRRHADALGFGTRFTILDRGDSVDLMGIVRAELLDDLASDGGASSAEGRRRAKRFPRADTLVNLISRHVNTQAPIREILEEQHPSFLDDHDAILEIEGRYRRRKKEQNVMDYDDLLVHLRDLLAEHPSIRRRIASEYRYVMVDEYQDTNRLQAHVTALLASGHGNLMVVGDDAQSIYSFRGADFRNILDFEAIFPDAERILLEQNYRSTQPILDLGNAVLEQAREKFDKRLFTELRGDADPRLVRTPDDHGQADYVCRRVLALREEGVPLNDMAVLTRAAWHSNTLELELQNRNIPFRKFGGIRFVEAAHVKDVAAILRLAVNPSDTSAWFRVLQLFEGIGPKTARSITGHVLERGADPRVLVQPKLSSKKYGEDLRALSELLLELGDSKRPLAARLERVLEVYRPWMTRQYDDARRRAQDFESILVVAESYEEVETFLVDLAIDPPEFARGGTAGDGEDEWLTVSTIHSAKGLEWHAVFLLELNAGRFPSYAALRTDDDLEEERRLLYVAVTRAKRELHLLKPEVISSRSYGREVGELTPLLAEIPTLGDLVEEVHHVPGVEPGVGGGAEGAGDASGDGAGDAAERLRRIQDYFG